MGPTPTIVIRALFRVGQSSAGEVIGRAVNLVLPFAILALHSVDLLTDTFFLALAVAFFVQGTLANVVSSIQITELVKDNSRRSIRTFLPWVLAAGVLSGSVALWFTVSSLAVTAAVVASLSVMLAAGAGLLAAPAVAVLNADHRYFMPGITWSFRIFPLIAYVLWAPDTPKLHWLLAGIALADSLRTWVLLRLASGRLTLRGDEALTFPTDALYLMMGSAIAGLTPLAARWIAAFGDAGGVSVFEAADRTYGAVASLATIGIGNVILVYLARLSGTDDEHRVWRWILLSGSIWSLLWLILAMLIWAIFPSLVGFLQQQSGTTLVEMRSTFLALCVGLPGFIMCLVLSRRILTLGLARRLLPVAVAGLAVSVTVGWLLSGHLGTTGVALGIVAGQYIGLLLMIYYATGVSPKCAF
jgi:peptidoglycan biosynthesis protein MviN/MurJ (putative lipid II flippase)